MDTKENSTASSFPIKPEPTEPRLIPLTHAQNTSQTPVKRVKTEPSFTTPATKQLSRTNSLKRTPSKAFLDPRAHVPQAPAKFQLFENAADFDYTPESAIEHGMCMVESITQRIQALELGNLRKEVWAREIAKLRSQATPQTLIAVCGATGAGKSSILNAILDDHIVPTSGFRACTAVVTEIAYHKKKSIDADVSFLNETEWKQELEVLKDDLLEDDGTLKRCTDLKSDAGIAWSKVHSVYPTLTQEKVAKMSADEIIKQDPKIAKVLGTTKTITTKNSKAFAEEISKYIDSKDKRGKKNKKKASDKSIEEEARDLAKKKKDGDGPALWPLIRQVNVRCAAKALETGAVLVDLPGVADANAARNNIAKDYMKKANCIWILAPITRAVDDKTARDLLGDAFKTQLLNGAYDDTTITFIATKCDDISCSEVIDALELENDPALEEIQDKLDNFSRESNAERKKESELKKDIQGLDRELKKARAILKEYQDHLVALEAGEEFTPKLTKVKPVVKQKSPSPISKKRKNTRGGKEGSSKRRRGSPMDSEDEVDDTPESSEESDNDSDNPSNHDSDSDDASDKDDSDEHSEKDSDAGSTTEEEGDEEAKEEVTTEFIGERIKESKEQIKALREGKNTLTKTKKETADVLAVLKKNITKSQRAKASFCSHKRSEISKDILREDFRTGLKDLDDIHAEETNPDDFDPSHNVRDYAAINLPVFTVSARDYTRIKGQVKGDGDPTCFTNPVDTEVPALQEWCQHLTVSSRERTARNFVTHLSTFAKGVESYTRGIGEVTAADRAAMKAKWESSQTFVDGYDFSDDDDDDDDPVDAILNGRAMYTMPQRVRKVDTNGEPIGVTARLEQEFESVADQCEGDLKKAFNQGLEAKCREGATQGSKNAVKTVDQLAASMHWASYRATLRRHGSFRRDLNVELANPFTRCIAQSWGHVFEQQLLKDVQNKVEEDIRKLLRDIETSAALGLQDRIRTQGEACMEEAKVALQAIINTVNDTLTSSQKEISRSISPGIQNELIDGYDRAMEERGKGSVARQKTFFHSYVDGKKQDLFEDSSDAVMGQLNATAKAVATSLKEAIAELADKVEVNLAVLWEDIRDDPKQVRARADLIRTVDDVLGQLEIVKEASVPYKEKTEPLESGDVEMLDSV